MTKLGITLTALVLTLASLAGSTSDVLARRPNTNINNNTNKNDNKIEISVKNNQNQKQKTNLQEAKPVAASKVKASPKPTPSPSPSPTPSPSPKASPSPTESTNTALPSPDLVLADVVENNSVDPLRKIYFSMVAIILILGSASGLYLHIARRRNSS